MAVARRILCVSLVFALVLSARSVSADGLKKLATIEGISEFRLENGLQILLYPDQSKQTVTVNLTIFVGSRHEGYGEAGMAHLLEHMVFKGTPAHENIPQLLQERGASFNGTTWVDRTNYYETLPAKGDNLEFAIRLEADRMMNSYIKGEDLASEMTVVRNEFERGENSPSRILRQRMASIAFDWHNYGKSTIGNRSDIERVPLPKLRTFYRRHYQPDNAMIVIAGKFEEAAALKHVEKYFGKIPAPERKLDRTYTEEPAQDGERLVTLRRVGDVSLVSVAYHVPSGAHPGYAAVDILGYILATEPAGRLYKALVETKKASSIYGGSYAWHDPGLLFMMLEVPKDGSIDEVRDTVTHEMEKIGDEGVTEEEVERVKRQILKQRELSLSDSGRIAVDLSEWAAQGDWRLFFLYRDRIEQVTAEEVQAAAQNYLQQSNRTVGIFIPTEKPERTTIPATPDLEKMVAGYKGRKAVVAGEQFDPSPANIEARTTRLTLPSGLKVAILPKKTRGQSVRLSLSLNFGSAETLVGRYAACGLLARLMRRGTTGFSFQELEDELDKNSVALSASSAVGSASFGIETKRDNLPAAIQLLTEILRHPTFPADEFEVLRRERLTNLENSRSNPQALAPRKLGQILAPYPPGDIRYSPDIDDLIDWYSKVTLEDVQELYQNFIHGEDGELVIVGDFDPDMIMPSIEGMLASWEAKQPYKRIAYEAFTKVQGGSEVILTPDKANAIYYAGLVTKINDTDADYPALLIGNFVLGGGSLASRLGDRVRQKDGLSYGVGSGFSAGSQDDIGRLTIYAISNPTNSPKVVAAINEELTRLVNDGITEEELARAKQGFLQAQNLSRTNDGQLAGTLSRLLFNDRTMSHYEELEEKIRSLSAADVQIALKKHLDPKRLFVVTAGDFPE